MPANNASWEWVKGEEYDMHTGEAVGKVQLTLWPNQKNHITELMYCVLHSNSKVSWKFTF